MGVLHRRKRVRQELCTLYCALPLTKSRLQFISCTRDTHFCAHAARRKQPTLLWSLHFHWARGKLFERANFNQQSDEPKSSSMNISQCRQTRQKEGKKEKAPKVHFSFLPTGSVRRRRCSKTARRAAISRMKNHAAKFTLLVGCVKNGLLALA